MKSIKLGNKISLIALLTIIVFSLFQGITSVSANTEGPINVDIEEAYYSDLDNDGFNDDVFVLLRFDLTGSSYYEYGYLITLTLPSGTSYSYIVIVRSLVDTVYTKNYFWDHATECGDYTVTVQALLNVPYTFYDTDTEIFDPPGGSEGGKPGFSVGT